MTGGLVPLVDTHVHLFTRALPLAARAWTRPEGELTAETFLSMMDEHGVGYGVVSAMSLLGDLNDYTIDALREHERLRGTVIVDPTTDRYVLERMKADGVVGVRFQWRRLADLPDLTDPAYRRLLFRIADLDWHVEVNIEGDRLPPVLDRLTASGVKVVVDHFGDPDRESGYAGAGGAALLRALGTGRVWVKLSAGYRFGVGPDTLAGHAATLIEAAGPEHVFWGSDAPFVGARRQVTYRDAVNSFAHLVPDAELRRRISLAAHAFYFG
ncbi:amidohydrolase [Nonomuraea sp. KC401]|nr:amidohydrolase family protein [Nonomuraea sp. K271]NBE91787.1 amidohydrolase family protein [Nonomuraea sp. K271]TLF86387.1 amidohydrolase [Nonomuraea sp. KC401]